MNKELNESESVIVFSQGDIQQEHSHEELDKSSYPINSIPPKIQPPSTSLSDSNSPDTPNKSSLPETIVERNENSEQDGSDEDSFVAKSEKDEIEICVNGEEKVESGQVVEEEPIDLIKKEKKSEMDEDQKQHEHERSLTIDQGNNFSQPKEEQKQANQDSFEIQDSKEKLTEGTHHPKENEKLQKEKSVDESAWFEAQSAIENPKTETQYNFQKSKPLDYPETDADWEKPQTEIGRGRGRGRGSDFRSESEDLESPSRGRGGFKQYGRGQGQNRFEHSGRGRGGRGQGGSEFRGRGEGRGQGGFRGRGRGGNGEGFGRGRGNGEDGEFRGRGRGWRGRGFSGRNEFDEGRYGGERENYDFDFRKKSNILPERVNEKTERNLCEVPGDVSIISKLEEIEPLFNSTFEPEGQKCWPEVSLYVLRVKVSLTFRHLLRHKADLLIIPCIDPYFKLYPGNILNRSPFNYREKLEEKKFFTAGNEGEVYLQKCVGIENFKAFAFMKVGENSEYVGKCVESLILKLTQIDTQVKSVVLPYSQSIKSVLPILDKLFEGFNKMKFKSKLSEFVISTNQPEAFNNGCLEFIEFVNKLIENNEICIEF